MTKAAAVRLKLEKCACVTVNCECSGPEDEAERSF